MLLPREREEKRKVCSRLVSWYSSSVGGFIPEETKRLQEEDEFSSSESGTRMIIIIVGFFSCLRLEPGNGLR